MWRDIIASLTSRQDMTLEGRKDMKASAPRVSLGLVAGFNERRWDVVEWSRGATKWRCDH